MLWVCFIQNVLLYFMQPAFKQWQHTAWDWSSSGAYCWIEEAGPYGWLLAFPQHTVDSRSALWQLHNTDNEHSKSLKTARARIKRWWTALWQHTGSVWFFQEGKLIFTNVHLKLQVKRRTISKGWEPEAASQIQKENKICIVNLRWRGWFKTSKMMDCFSQCLHLKTRCLPECKAEPTAFGARVTACFGDPTYKVHQCRTVSPSLWYSGSKWAKNKTKPLRIEETWN